MSRTNLQTITTANSHPSLTIIDAQTKNHHSPILLLGKFERMKLRTNKTETTFKNKNKPGDLTMDIQGSLTEKNIEELKKHMRLTPKKQITHIEPNERDLLKKSESSFHRSNNGNTNFKQASKAADCSGSTPYSGKGVYSENCYDISGCEALSGHIVDRSTNTCRPESECKNDANLKIYTNFEGVRFCISFSNCKLISKYIVAEDECRDFCTPGNEYLYESSNSCYSFSRCGSESKYPVTTSNSDRLCLDQELCKSHSEFSFTEDTNNCINTSDCWQVFGLVGPNCRENSCPSLMPYFKTDTKYCYSLSSCQDQNLTPLTNSNQKKLCLDQNLCQAHSDFSYNLNTQSCIPNSDCKAFVFGKQDGTCYSYCPDLFPYFNEASKTCYSKAQCKENSMFPLQDSKKNLHCIKDTECDSHSDFSLTEDTSKCILTDSCRVTAYSSKTNICRELSCPDFFIFLNINSKICYSYDTCLSRNYSPVEDQNSNKLCLSPQECKDYAGLSLILVTSTCVKTEDCPMSMIDDPDVDKFCRTSCPPESDYLDFEEKVCYSQSNCESASKFLVSGTSKKYCLTKAECLKHNNFSFNLDRNLCVLKSSCSRTVFGTDAETCRDSCPSSHPYLNKNSRVCYDSSGCVNQSMLTILSSSGQVYCLTVSECKAHEEFSFNTGTNKCIPTSECKVTEFGAEAGTCRYSCTGIKEYLNPEKNICYNVDQCKSDSKYQVINSNSKKLCLTKEECQNDPNLAFNTDSLTCTLTSTCKITKVSGKDEEVCLNKCPETDSYLNERTSICYSSENCKSASMTSISKDGKDYCLSKEDCKAHPEFTFNTETNACIFTSDCKVTVFLGEQNTCRDSCPQIAPYINDEGKVCYSSETCINYSKYPIQAEDGTKLCLTRDQCKNYQGFKLNSQTNTCIPTQNCLVTIFGSEDNTCRNSCLTSDPYINKKGDICYSSSNCKKSSLHPVSKTSGEKICLTVNQCLEDASLSFNTETFSCVKTSDCVVTVYGATPKTCRDSCSQQDPFLNLNESICYSEATCRSVGKEPVVVTDNTLLHICLNQEECKAHKQTLWNVDKGTCYEKMECLRIDGKDDGICHENCPVSHPFMNSALKICFTSSGCGISGKYSTTDASGNKLCLTREECISHSDLSFNLDSSKCILTTNCPMTVSNKKGTCWNGCPSETPYKLQNNVCYNAKDCRMNFLGIPLIPSGTDVAECISSYNCRKKAGYLEDIERSECIATSACPSTKIIVENQCRSNCHLYQTDDGSSCLTQEQCNQAKKYPAEGNSQKYCLSKLECENKFGFLFDSENNKCITPLKCTTDNRFIKNEEKNCGSVCGDYRSLDEKFCYTEAECSSLTTPHYLFSGNGQNLCLTEQECRGKSGYLIEYETKICIEKEKCKNKSGFLHDVNLDNCILEKDCQPSTKFIVEGANECSSSCIHLYKKTEGGCILRTTCEGKGYFATQSQGKNFCFTKGECFNEPGFLYDFDNKKCITESECSQPRFIIEGKECRNVCNNYVSFDERKCYNSSECRELEIKTELVYQAVQGNSKDYCLSENECRKKPGFLFNVNDLRCIKETDCPYQYFVLEETGECNMDCNDYMSSNKKKCYTLNKCKELNMYIIENQGKKYCLSQGECQVRDEFLFHLENKNCIRKSECFGEYFIIEEKGQCSSNCQDYLTKDKKCWTENNCKNSNRLLAQSDDNGQKYCFTEKECKNEEGYLIRKHKISEPTCISKKSCTIINGSILDGECLDECPTWYRFYDEEGNCLKICPDELFLQVNSFQCVKESSCKFEDLEGVLVGNPVTNRCVIILNSESFYKDSEFLKVNTLGNENQFFLPLQNLRKMDLGDNKVSIEDYIAIPLIENFELFSREQVKHMVQGISYRRKVPLGSSYENILEFLVIKKSETIKFLVAKSPSNKEIEVRVDFELSDTPVQLQNGKIVNVRVKASLSFEILSSFGFLLGISWLFGFTIFNYVV